MDLEHDSLSSQQPDSGAEHDSGVTKGYTASSDGVKSVLDVRILPWIHYSRIDIVAWHGTWEELTPLALVTGSRPTEISRYLIYLVETLRLPSVSSHQSDSGAEHDSGSDKTE